MGRTKKDMKRIVKTALGALISAGILAASAPFCMAKPGDNIMLGAKLHESSGYINGEERDEFLFDGDYDTKWCATAGDAKYRSSEMKELALDGYIHILSVDFGAEKYFDRYKLYLASTGARDYGQTGYNASAWKIQISSDGKVWTDVSRVTDSYDDEVVSVNVGIRKARYLRILVDEPEQSGGTTVRLYELEVFECEPGEVATGVVKTNGSNIGSEKEAPLTEAEDQAEESEEESDEEIVLGYVPSEAIEYEGYELGAAGIVAIIALGGVAAVIAVLAARRAGKEQLY